MGWETATTPGADGAGGSEEPSSDRDEAGTPDEIGRYRILDVLGSGGMGVVYLARDPRLERNVAIKLVKPSVLGSAAGGPAVARLLREGQAMAKLSHPHVVTVFDVGTWNDQVYIAQEFVEASTLTAWLSGEQRTYGQVLDAFIQAGRGLSAAHAAGVVHRDFKPSNVLVSADGSVRVLDFGVALLVESPKEPSGESSEADNPPLLSQRITAAGTVMGTPRYMSPEQLLGRQTGPSTDQFAFCVALYEALYGQHPFEKTTTKAFLRAIRSGDLQVSGRHEPGPRSILPALRRGLAYRPEERWASMDELLAALTRPALWPPSRGWVAASVLALVGGGAWIAWSSQAVPDKCQGAGSRIEEAWGPSRRSAVREAFEASQFPFAPQAWEEARAQLDVYARTWTAAYRDACISTHLRHEQTEAVLDLRMRCLSARLRELSALTRVLAEADRGVVARAVANVSALPSLEECADPDRLQRDTIPPPPAGKEVEMEALRERLSTVRALHLAGRYDAAAKRARPLEQRARAVGYEPLLMKVLTEAALVERHDFERRQNLLQEAYSIANSMGVDLHVADSAGLLARFAAEDPTRYDDVLQWGRHAQAALERGQLTGSRIEGMLLTTLASARHQHGETAAATADARRAVELLETASDARPRDLADAQSVLGDVVPDAESLPHYERALAIREQSFGSYHPDVAVGLNNVAVALIDSGEIALATKHLERALSIWESFLGPDDPFVGIALVNVAGIHRDAKRLDIAHDYYQRAETIFARAPGAEQLHRAAALLGLGLVAMDEDRFADAIAHHRAAIELFEQHAQHPDLPNALSYLGDTLSAAGDPEAAVEPLERALSLSEQGIGDQSLAFYVRFSLARALWDSMRDRSRALALARDAEADMTALVASHPSYAPDLAQIQSWLEQRAGDGGNGRR